MKSIWLKFFYNLDLSKQKIELMDGVEGDLLDFLFCLSFLFKSFFFFLKKRKLLLQLNLCQNLLGSIFLFQNM